MTMNVDNINGVFELIGAVMVWLNVRRLWLDRSVKGVSWWAQGFFASWGWWNMIYYSALSQWWSFTAGCFLTAGTTAWVVLALMYAKELQPAKQDHQRIQAGPGPSWKTDATAPKSGREAFENYQRNTGGVTKWNHLAATQRMAWFDMIDRPLLAKYLPNEKKQ